MSVISEVTGVAVGSHAHKAFIESAVADGWKVAEGPWGYSEGHERTVSLTKHFPALQGSVLLWMIHRNIGNMQWSKEKARWVTEYPENGWMVGVEAWNKADAGGDQNLQPKLEDVLTKGLSADFWTSLAFTCDNCGETVEQVHHVAFANKACIDCAPGMVRKMEYPGWAD